MDKPLCLHEAKKMFKTGHRVLFKPVVFQLQLPGQLTLTLLWQGLHPPTIFCFCQCGYIGTVREDAMGIYVYVDAYVAS